MVTRRGRCFIGLAVAFAAALALAGCGRKAGLDQPPETAVADPMFADHRDPGPGHDVEGKPVPPPGQKKRTPLLDWLIN